MQRTVIGIIALIMGLTLIAGSATSFAAGSATVAPRKQNWKKPRAKKSKG
jgi:hypothetical protein